MIPGRVLLSGRGGQAAGIASGTALLDGSKLVRAGLQPTVGTAAFLWRKLPADKGRPQGGVPVG